ncbi:hypothetical protein F4802DRAFT_597113 [Xylaria palmicola]|nr:hypothetical protein F4802DRAFT_597113 [Xylaria palmicola]
MRLSPSTPRKWSSRARMRIDRRTHKRGGGERIVVAKAKQTSTCRTATIRHSNAGVASIRRRRQTRAQNALCPRSRSSIRGRRTRELRNAAELARGATVRRELRRDQVASIEVDAELYSGSERSGGGRSRPPEAIERLLPARSRHSFDMGKQSGVDGDSVGMFGYGSKRRLEINRSVDRCISASTTAARRRSKLSRPTGPHAIARLSIEALHDAGDLMSAVHTGCSGGAVMGHEEERGERGRSIARLLIPSWRLSVLPRWEPAACSTPTGARGWGLRLAAWASKLRKGKVSLRAGLRGHR